ncbi:hypothetical protein PCK2_000701, partial [Pneumocystis canis]
IIDMSSGSKLSVYKKSSIYERHLNRTKGTEINQAAFSFLFSEIVRYTQKKVQGIHELEKRCVFSKKTKRKCLMEILSRLNAQGYRVGQKLLELITWREKNSKREIRILGILQFIFSNVWKTIFNKQADALEKSRENEDEYMIVDNEPMVNKYISVPKEMAQLNCAAFVAELYLRRWFECINWEVVSQRQIDIWKIEGTTEEMDAIASKEV